VYLPSFINVERFNVPLLTFQKLSSPTALVS